MRVKTFLRAEPLLGAGPSGVPGQKEHPVRQRSGGEASGQLLRAEKPTAVARGVRAYRLTHCHGLSLGPRRGEPVQRLGGEAFAVRKHEHPPARQGVACLS
ncbi:hypothetical protein Smic_04830 [Streptomyces microflavus]|uniref:Uncharacterized protein n=1 Tax=Streptomyces microflavus TaxID=1919 RepID=A0A7J0CJM5_STRMI|nr:hypothetical protein Smic_04830 [Streptomyces microflavus]